MPRQPSCFLGVSLLALGLALPVGHAFAQSSGGAGASGGGTSAATGSAGDAASTGSPASAPAQVSAGDAQSGSVTSNGEAVRPDGDTATNANAETAPATGTPEVVASLAVPNGPAPSAYMTGSVRVSDADMTAFLANPTNLLSLYADGGLSMSNYVRLLAASDNRAVPTLLTLGADPATTAAQKTAIGSGLARAAIGAQIASPPYAAYIQQQVAASQDPALIAAFTSTLAEPATAAFGGAGAGGGAAGAGGGSLTGGGEGGTNGGLGNTPVRNLESSAAFTRSAVVSGIGDDDDGDGSGVVFVPLFITPNDGSPTN